jgi:NAD+ synthetase
MKIALAQTNPLIGDFSRNSEKIISVALQAREQGCDMVIFPELSLCGYPPQDLLERASFLVDHEAALQKLVSSISGIAVLCGTLEPHTGESGKPLHNSAVLFEDGEILFTTRKRLLPTYDVFDEARYFEPGGASEVFLYKGKKLGISICEDIWNDKDSFSRKLYAAEPVTEMIEAGADLLINIAASPYHIGKHRLRLQIFSSLASANSVPLLYVNQTGGQDSLLFDGRSMAIDDEGRLTALADRFSEDMLVVDLSASRPLESSYEQQDEQSEVFDALVMGVRDYTAKCGFSKVVLGLSGGIDSALTAAIACTAMGPDNVLCIALPSPYSSRESIEDAEQLAANLGCRFHTIQITDILHSYSQTLAPVLGDPATWQGEVTEQNIQARIRGNLLMALSNRHGSLLLTTGNKSELAVGYCTLYGDMSGGLAVIADVPKQLVYSLSRFINREKEIIPQRIIDKPPSAELKPDQKDQDDLPPYEILDQILAAYLEENKSIADIVAMGFKRELVRDIVRRIKINEYKRKQAPTGLKVTTKSFGAGRRYPIAQNYQER